MNQHNVAYRVKINPFFKFKPKTQFLVNYKNISILWASTREAYNYIQARQLGCDIITMPPKIINQIENFGLSLDNSFM